MNDSGKKMMMSTIAEKQLGFLFQPPKYLDVVIYGYYKKITPFKSYDNLPVPQFYRILFCQIAI